jgi:hypothetical protein
MRSLLDVDVLIALLDAGTADPARIHGPRQVTDPCLLALAVVTAAYRRWLQLACIQRRLMPSRSAPGSAQP